MDRILFFPSLEMSKEADVAFKKKKEEEADVQMNLPETQFLR